MRQPPPISRADPTLDRLRRRRKQKTWPAFAAVATAMGILVGTAAYLSAPSLPGIPAGGLDPPHNPLLRRVGVAVGVIDDGKPAVEAWLAENLDSEEWSEVRWWPAVALIPQREKNLAEARHWLAEAEEQLAGLREKVTALERAGVKPVGEREPPDASTHEGYKQWHEWSQQHQKYDELRHDAFFLATESVPNAEQRIAALRQAPIPVVARIKFRAPSPIGSGTFLHDRLFRIENGKANPFEMSKSEIDATFP